MTDPLPPLRRRLSVESQRLQVPLDVIERDYALGHALAAIYARGALAETLVFKGGTALKKAYFGDYRFSVDLDFTAVAGPRSDDLEAEIVCLAADVERSLGIHGPFTVVAKRQSEQNRHPTGQEAFKLAVAFPWHRSPLCSIKIEVTTDEPLLLPVLKRALMHGYSEHLAAQLTCYTLEEIVAEKLRTIRQAEKRLDEGRWLRNCARDYYDLWSLCVAHGDEVNFDRVARILPAKLAVRGVTAESLEDYFPQRVMEGARRQWASSLAALVRPLPRFEPALEELKGILRTHLVG